VKRLSHTMIEFWDEGEHQRDHEEFKRWQRRHRHVYGQTLNNDRAEPAAVLHTLGCPLVWDFSSNPSASLTENRKVCSTVRGEVLEWADQHSREWVPCDTCTRKRVRT
jgi:hypothetical protein